MDREPRQVIQPGAQPSRQPSGIEPGHLSGYDGYVMDAFDFHHAMLVDEARTSSLQRAILATVKPGDVVVDIGPGTGALSLFGVMAGASRVYSIEREQIIEIPERAEALITETNWGLPDRPGISSSTWQSHSQTRACTDSYIVA